jgi:hypothetical protein
MAYATTKPDTEALGAQLHTLLAKNLIRAAQRELRMAQAIEFGVRAARQSTNRRKPK